MMSRGTGRPVVLIADARRAAGQVRFQRWDRAARFGQTAKALAALWGLALVSVAIPVAHFLLVPALLIAGQHVEDPEGRGRNDEEFDGDEVGEVVLEERPPGLRGRLLATRHESGNGALRDLEAELEQLAVNARRAPERIRERHGAHEIREL
jgi:hypothetical protein